MSITYNNTKFTFGNQNTKTELLNEAKKLDIKGRSSMSKKQLISSVNKSLSKSLSNSKYYSAKTSIKDSINSKSFRSAESIVRVDVAPPGSNTPVVSKSDVRCKEFDNKFFRLNLLKAFMCGLIKFTPCDIFESIKDDPFIFAGGSSEALIVVGKANMKKNTDIPKRIVIKVSFAYLKGNDNSTQVEIDVYKYITNPLILNGNTPHVMLYLTSGTCDHFLDSLHTQMHSNKIAESLFKKLLKHQNSPEVKSKGFNFNKANILVLEKGGGIELADFNMKIKLQSWFVILYQVLYSILCFQQVGLSHNDLHSGNIFVEVLPERKLMVYYDNPYNTISYKAIDTDIFCRILDFDLASVQPTDLEDDRITNTRLEKANYCKKINTKNYVAGAGICNFMNPKQDAFKFLFHVYHEPQVPKQVKTWIKKQVNKNLLQKMRVELNACWQGYLCGKLPTRTAGCFCEPFLPTDTEMKPLEKILQDFPISSINAKPNELQAQIQDAQKGLIILSALPSITQNKPPPTFDTDSYLTQFTPKNIISNPVKKFKSRTPSPPSKSYSPY